MPDWLMWMLTGVAAAMGFGAAVLCVIERDFRAALGQVVVGVLLGPTMLFVAATRSGPRLMSLSAAALERFAQQSTGEYGPGITKRDRAAWLLAYRDRGVIVLRRRGRQGWINNAPNSAQRARTDARRSLARVRDNESEVQSW